MNAISLWQPWATLVAIGSKRIETRDWCAPQDALGKPLAIHATKGTGPGGVAAFRKLINTDPFRRELANAGYDSVAHRGLYVDPETQRHAPLIPVEGLPRGAVVATAVLVRCTRMTQDGIDYLVEHNPIEAAFGDYRPGRYAWVLHDVRRIHPVPYPGGQKVWRLKGEARRLVEQGGW